LSPVWTGFKFTSYGLPARTDNYVIHCRQGNKSSHGIILTSRQWRHAGAWLWTDLEICWRSIM